MALRPPRLQQDPNLIPSVFRRLLDPSQQYQDSLTPAQNLGAAVPDQTGYNVLQPEPAGPDTPQAPTVRMPNVPVGPVDPQTGAPAPQPTATLADQAIARAQPTTPAAAPNVLAPSPATAQPATPAATETHPLPDYVEQGTVPDQRLARRVETDTRGRPKENIALKDPDERVLDYQHRLAAMPPDKEGAGWWPRIRTALAGFAAGGPVGAGVALGGRALHEHLDPEFASRQWKQEKLAQIAPSVGAIYQGRKEARAEEQAQTQADYNKVRTWKLLHPEKKYTIKQREDGVFVPVDDRGLDPEGKPVKGRLPAAASEWGTVTNDAGELVVFSKKTGLDQSGNPIKTKSMVQQPDGTYVSSEEVYKRGTAQGEATTANAGVDETIRAAREEQAKIDAQLGPLINTVPATKDVPDTQAEQIDDTSKPMVKNRKGQMVYQKTYPMKTIKNPAYEEVEKGLHRRQELDDQIRAAEQKRKYVPGSTTTTPTGGAKGGSQRGRKYDVSKYLQ